MKVLFSPSETKNLGGKEKAIDKNSFIFPENFDKRMEIINKYIEFILSASREDLIRIFGTKKEDLIEQYKKDISKTPTMKAILRYEGVAFEYLQYKSLTEKEQNYIDKNVLIFSNIFGPISSGDLIPDYKLKQGESFFDLKIEKFYNDNFSIQLDNYLEKDDIIDLRAGFYEKFYQIKQPYTTMKFIKDGKVVSHWAKAYRGTILRLLAKNDIKTVDDLLKMEIDKLRIEEIKKQKNKTEIVYSII